MVKGALVEYALSLPPLVLVFDFNPQTLSRTRSITVQTGNAPGTRGGYDFMLPTETPRVAQGVTVQPETFSIEILLDATDRMEAGDPTAAAFGIEAELDTLRTMIEPKSQGPGGLQMLASLGLGGERAFARHESPSVLLFVWGSHILPVFLTSVKVDEKHPDIGWTLYRFDTGAVGVLEDAWFLPDRTPFQIDERMEIIGTEGNIHIHPSKPASPPSAPPLPAASSSSERQILLAPHPRMRDNESRCSSTSLAPSRTSKPLLPGAAFASCGSCESDMAPDVGESSKARLPFAWPTARYVPLRSIGLRPTASAEGR